MTAPTPPAASSTSSSFDAWLLQKLRQEWSSREFGGLLTPSKLAEARASFPHLETPIKVRKRPQPPAMYALNSRSHSLL